MKIIKSLLVELVLPFLFCWFFMTVLVDIVTIPTVFRNIKSVEEAGNIGMIVFHRFNCFEIFFGFFVLVGTLYSKEKSKLMIAIASLLFILSLIYTFYMTPMITHATIAIHQTLPTDPSFSELQTKHAYYHTLYRYLDTGKLLVLLGFIGLRIHFNITRLHKECV